MQRIYKNTPLLKEEIFENETYHQLIRVMRMQIWSIIRVFNQFEEYEYELYEFDKKRAIFKQKSLIIVQKNENINITLYQAMPNRFEKLEWIVQKNTEIGIKKMVFFRSERSQKLIVNESKIKRLNTIAIEAIEQSYQMIPPELDFSNANFDTMLVQANHQENWCLHTENDNQPQKTIAKNIGIWIGPEWGWSDNEVIKMKENGFITARFWNSILRTETAGLVVWFWMLHS